MDLSQAMEILENMSDEQKAAELLAKLDAGSKRLGELVMNRDKSLPHNDWQKLCDQAKQEVDAVLAEIAKYQ